MTEETAIVKTEKQTTYSLEQLKEIGTMIAVSKLFGVKTPEQAIALCLIADAEGQHPALAATEYHIIQGQPSLKAKTLLARFQSAGGKIEWLESTDDRAEAKFSHPTGGELTIDWDMERAKNAGLTGKDNWKHYPRAMLRARVISEGVPALAPGTARFYTSEEVQDFDNVKPAPPAIKDKETLTPDTVVSPTGKEQKVPVEKTPAEKRKDTIAKKKAEADAQAAEEAKGKVADQKKTADEKLKDGAPKKAKLPPLDPNKTGLELLEGLEPQELTGAKINAAVLAKIEGALEGKHGISAKELEDWSKCDKADWTESVRINLLDVHRILVAKRADIEDFRSVLASRTEF